METSTAAPLFDSSIIREAQKAVDFMANAPESSQPAFIRAIAGAQQRADLSESR